MSQFRIEHDLLGDRQVPDEVYYGVHTLRAKENFHITGTPISTDPELINALALVKQAAAQAQAQQGADGEQGTNAQGGANMGDDGYYEAEYTDVEDGNK